MKTMSGSELVLAPAPFADAKALLTAFLKEARGVEIKGREELPNLMKNIICAAVTSPEMDAALAKCMERCRYRGLKIVADTFEAIDARQDYLEVCYLVAEENLRPFMNSLYAKFVELSKKLESFQA